MKIKFDWDSSKAGSNFKKHGISFELAITVFDDPYALIAPDEKHSTPEEEREWSSCSYFYVTFKWSNISSN